jgi:iron complex outermembrane recepter protein
MANSKSFVIRSVFGLFTLAPLYAQQTATLSGAILDQAGKSIEGATVSVKGPTAATVNSGADGRFSAPNLAPGDYTLDASAPGFARASRIGIELGAGQSQDVSLTLKVDAISQSVTVQESVSLAVDEAPQGNTLEATSARTEITSAVMQNFMAPWRISPKSFSRRPTPSA